MEENFQMIKKTILLILIIAAYKWAIHPQDESATISGKIPKATEVSIGGGMSILELNDLSMAPVVTIIQSVKVADSQYVTRGYTYNDLKYGFGVETFLTSSFIFYPLSSFGIGFTNILGTSTYYFGNDRSVGKGRVELYIKTLLEFKCGSIDTGKFFIFDLGMNAGIDFLFGADVYQSADAVWYDLTVYLNNLRYHYYFDYEKLHLGPSLFLGYGRIYSRGFSFTVGGMTDLKISLYDKYDYRDDRYYKIYDFAIETGIQIRWQGSLVKKY